MFIIEDKLVDILICYCLITIKRNKMKVRRAVSTVDLLGSYWFILKTST